MKIILVYTPVSDAEEAHALGSAAVRQKLAACANSLPASSVYFWEGEIQNDSEVILLLKTTADKQAALRQFIEEHHSYALPAILSWKVKVNPEYGQWVSTSTT